MRPRQSIHLIGVAFVFCIGVLPAAHAQEDFPAGKPIEMTVLFPAGTSADVTARVLVETPLLVVKADAPWKDLRELVAYAKTRPATVTVGNSGAGSHTHFSAAMLFKAAGVEVIDVPFGAAQVVPSVLGGHVNCAMQLPGALATHVRSGSLRVIAALSRQRDAAFADVPTASEQGVPVVADAWRGIAVPKGTPRAVLAKLENAIRRTVASAEFVKASDSMSVTPAFLPAAAFTKLMAQEDADVAKVMQALGLKKSPD